MLFLSYTAVMVNPHTELYQLSSFSGAYLLFSLYRVVLGAFPSLSMTIYTMLGMMKCCLLQAGCFQLVEPSSKCLL